MTIKDRWNDSDRGNREVIVTKPVPPLLGAFAKLRQATISFVLSFRMEQLGSHWTDFHAIWYLNVYRKSNQKIQVSLKLTKITGTVHEDQYTFSIISRSVLLKMKTISDRRCRGNQNTYFMFFHFF